MIKPRKLTTAQAAAEVGCHVETIRRAIRRKELLASYDPAGRGRGFIIVSHDLAAWLERRRVSR
jgi:excisionase family DNA binding protein